MKKWIIILLVLCLLGAGAIGYFSSRSGAAEPQIPGDTPETDAESGVMAKIYALHAPDEVVMTVGGEEITWETYFAMLHNLIRQQENNMSYYGMSMDWSLTYDEEGHTYADMALEQTEQTLKQMIGVENFAAKNKVELTEEDRTAMDESIQQLLATYFDEGATEEDLNARLAEGYMPRSLYDRMVEQSFLIDRCYEALYGENAEKISDEAAIAYLTANNYVFASHILFLNTDSETGESLEEAAKEEKLATAQRILDELNAIEDPQERAARFAELKQEYCEDGGKVDYPKGYLFPAGQQIMVQEFEDAILGLEEYQVSELVESSYGWHLIIRLPLDPDETVFDPYGGGSTARVLAATEQFNDEIEKCVEDVEVRYAEGFERPALLDFLMPKE